MNSPVRAFRGVGGDAALHRPGQGRRRSSTSTATTTSTTWAAGGRSSSATPTRGDARRSHEALQERLQLRRPSPRGDPAGRAGPGAGPLDREDALRLLRAPRPPPPPSGWPAASPAVTTSSSSTAATTAPAIALLVKAGSGVETLGLPDSPGVPADVARHTLTAPLQRPAGGREAPRRARRHPSPRSSSSRWWATWACSSRGRATCRGSSTLCRKHGALLIVDEVMTGFRLGAGRRLRGSTGSGPTSSPSARSSAAACRWAPSAAAPT